MDSSYIDMDKWMNAGSDAGSEQTDWLPTMSLGLVVLIILIVLFIIYGIPYIRKLIALSRTQTLYNSLKKTVDTVLVPQEQNSVTQRQSALFGTAAAQSNPDADTYIGYNNICGKSGQNDACEKICNAIDKYIAELIEDIKLEIAMGLLRLFQTIGTWKEWGNLKEGVQSLDAGTISLINLAMCKMIDLLSTNTSTSCGQAELAEQDKLSTLIQDLESLMKKIENIPFGDIFKNAIKNSMGTLITAVQAKIANHISAFLTDLNASHPRIYLAVMSILTKACSRDACGSDANCTTAVTNAIKAIRSVNGLEDIKNGPKVALYLLNQLIPKSLNEAKVAKVAKVLRYVCNATNQYIPHGQPSLKWKVADSEKYTYVSGDPTCLNTGSTDSTGCCSLSDYQKFVSNVNTESSAALREVQWCNESKND
jgi:hypothetical protein